jgi:hypothetical protein
MGGVIRALAPGTALASLLHIDPSLPEIRQEEL